MKSKQSEEKEGDKDLYLNSKKDFTPNDHDDYGYFFFPERYFISYNFNDYLFLKLFFTFKDLETFTSHIGMKSYPCLLAPVTK